MGKQLGLYLDADGHAVMTLPELRTTSHVFPMGWAHFGRAVGTCRSVRWAVDGYDATPLSDGTVPQRTEPTFRSQDVLAFEPETPVKVKRSHW